MPPPIRVFLVDDHPMIRDSLATRMESTESVEVVGEAAHAHEALERIELVRPDVVLMDVRLRGASGIDLMADLLERHPGLAVLMLSMYDRPQYVRRAVEAGARGYVLKGSSSDELLAALQAVVAGGRYFSPPLEGALE